VGLGAPFEALNDDLFDVHVCAGAVDSTAESKKYQNIATSFTSQLRASIWKSGVEMGGCCAQHHSNRCRSTKSRFDI
jgi:hypothetical protein